MKVFTVHYSKDLMITEVTGHHNDTSFAVALQERSVKALLISIIIILRHFVPCQDH